MKHKLASYQLLCLERGSDHHVVSFQLYISIQNNFRSLSLSLFQILKRCFEMFRYLKNRFITSESSAIRYQKQKDLK